MRIAFDLDDTLIPCGHRFATEPPTRRARWLGCEPLRTGTVELIRHLRARGWEGERRLNVTQVRLGEYEYNKRRCTRVETIHPARKEFLYYRSVVYFDQQNRLPIRVECYDWPRAQGDPGQLTEVFSFVNLRLNVGLSDAVFNH